MTIHEREQLPGQSGRKIYPVRCDNPCCGKKNIVNNIGTQLLGYYYPGTRGQVKCSRCGTLNCFEVKGNGSVKNGEHHAKV
jgi:hypothetical protein